MGEIALARAPRGIELAGRAPRDGPLGPRAQFQEIDLGLIHEALPRCQALTWM